MPALRVQLAREAQHLREFRAPVRHQDRRHRVDPAVVDPLLAERGTDSALGFESERRGRPREHLLRRGEPPSEREVRRCAAREHLGTRTAREHESSAEQFDRPHGIPPEPQLGPAEQERAVRVRVGPELREVEHLGNGIGCGSHFCGVLCEEQAGERARRHGAGALRLVEPFPARLGVGREAHGARPVTLHVEACGTDAQQGGAVAPLLGEARAALGEEPGLTADDELQPVRLDDFGGAIGPLGGERVPGGLRGVGAPQNSAAQSGEERVSAVDHGSVVALVRVEEQPE